MQQQGHFWVIMAIKCKYKGESEQDRRDIVPGEILRFFDLMST